MWNLHCQDVCARVWLVISSLHTIVQMEDLRYILYQPLLTSLKLQKGYRQVKSLFFRFLFPTYASSIASLKNHTAVFPMAYLPRFTFSKKLCRELTLLVYCFHVSFEQPSLGAQWLQLKNRLRKLAGPKKKNYWKCHRKWIHQSQPTGENQVNLFWFFLHALV